MEKTIICPFCGETMTAKKTHGDQFWDCPGCRVEVWPYEERVEKAIRKSMQTAPAKKKGSGGHRRSRQYKSKKPGQKFTPWYQR